MGSPFPISKVLEWENRAGLRTSEMRRRGTCSKGRRVVEHAPFFP